MIGAFVAVAIASLSLAWATARLGGAGYSKRTTISMASFASLQFLTALTATALAAFALALIVYAGAISAAEFTRRQSARNVIVLGTSLSLAQTVSPMGAFLTAALVPALAAINAPRSRALGYFALLLFLPAASAFLLLLFARRNGFDIGSVGHSALDGIIPVIHSVAPKGRAGGLLKTALLLAVAAPVFPLRWIESRVAIALIAIALIGSIALDVFLDRAAFFAVFAPAVSSVQLAAIAEGGMSERWALGWIAASAVLCWAGAMVLA